MNNYPKPQTPSELHKLFGKYFLEKDTEGLWSLFDNNAIFITGKNSEHISGKSKILETLATYMNSGVSMETLSVSTHINGDTALVRSEWAVSGTELSGVALEVMKYKDGGWLYLIDNPNGF